MLPLLVLLGSTGVALAVFRILTGKIVLATSGRIGMSVMLLFTAMGHFMFTEGMAAMIPDFIPYKTAMVYMTGGIEILAAIGLQIPKLQRLTALLLIIFFITILPANIQAAIDQLDYQTGASTGAGVAYLWFRVPLQVLFIAWVYVFAVRKQ